MSTHSNVRCATEIQQEIDIDRAQMANEIVAAQNITTVEEGKRFARAWIITAIQYATNADYFRKERDEAVRVMREYVEVNGVEHDDPYCPEDDTCECPTIANWNAVLR